MKRIDLRGQLKYLYRPSSSEVQTVDVPRFKFLMVDGEGDPNGGEFGDAISTLYSLSYTLKFTLKKPLKALDRARLESFHEGLSAQIMHIGPYSAEGPTIKRLHEYIKESGGKPRGRHHEIYLGDPRRAAPSKLRTIIRQPFER